ATLSANDTHLILSGPEHRRRLLDRLAFQLKPQVLDLLLRYRQALRQRNAALVQHHLATLDAFDRELARWGAKLTELRVATLRLLVEALEGELSHLGWLGGKPVLRYHAPEGLAASAGGEQFLLSQLRRVRSQELARGHTLVGPHRHDVCITISGRPARELLSAGQTKLLATSLRLASVAVTTSKRKVAPLVIFDDVDAELDREALGRLLTRLAALSPQVVVSTAHPEVVLPSCPEASVVPMRGGTLAPEERSRW
ncbi:MAG: DNA replication/repair protein RecF, partial [Thermoanaerobaculum sp.]